VLRFGAFVNKGGRKTPYFFNAGLFTDGSSLGQLGHYYADALRAANVPFDMLFGPAYKGITLAASTAIALAETGKSVPFSFNRKEAKDHGEGGDVVGAQLKGNVVIIDDVITDGGAKREAIERVQSAGARAVAILIAFDRQESGLGELSAVQELQRDFGVPLISIATLDDLFAYIESQPTLAMHASAIAGYRAIYGVK
jgi:orotate phosphoribosyltransferase